MSPLTDFLSRTVLGGVSKDFIPGVDFCQGVVIGNEVSRRTFRGPEGFLHMSGDSAGVNSVSTSK